MKSKNLISILVASVIIASAAYAGRTPLNQTQARKATVHVAEHHQADKAMSATCQRSMGNESGTCGIKHGADTAMACPQVEGLACSTCNPTIASGHHGPKSKNHGHMSSRKGQASECANLANNGCLSKGVMAMHMDH